jgi:hypothetical protein
MAESKRPLNYTTTIPAERTAGECQHLLGRSGASAVAVHFEDGEPAGLSFRLDTPHGRRDFTLPVNIDGMLAVLRKTDFSTLHQSRRQRDAYQERQHAANVAWRVVKDWLEANLALIAAGMATLDEAMLPYLVVDEGRTLYQAYREREGLPALLPGSTR